MLSLLLSYVRAAAQSKWLFITAPVGLGTGTLILGLSLLPQKPAQFLADQIPYLELNLVTHCADERSQLGAYTGRTVAIDDMISQNSEVYLSRTGETEFELIVDVFGLIGKQQGNFRSSSRIRDLFFGGLEVGRVESDENVHFPHTIPHYCEKLQIVANPDDKIDIETTGEFRLVFAEREEQGAAVFLRSPRLAEKPISDIRNLLIRDRFADRGFQLDFPPTDSANQHPELIGVRFGLDCQHCLRGNQSLADLALSLFLIKRGGGALLGQRHFLPVHAVANEQYAPVKWEGDEFTQEPEIVERGNDVFLSPDFGGTVLPSTWLDHDAERKRSARYTLAGVIIGLGMTLLVEALIAALYHLFYVRDS